MQGIVDTGENALLREFLTDQEKQKLAGETEHPDVLRDMLLVCAQAREIKFRHRRAARQAKHWAAHEAGVIARRAYQCTECGHVYHGRDVTGVWHCPHCQVRGADHRRQI